MQKPGLTLVLGGVRSGKSRFAQQLVAPWPAVTYLATGQVTDAEMQVRVERHKQERPAHWRTVEASRNLAGVIRELPEPGAVLLDDLGFVLADVLWRGGYEQSDPALLARLEREFTGEVVGIAAAADRQRIVVVSNEVGQSLVAATPVGRAFTDLLGRANQRLAEAADQVFVCWAGIPVEIKTLAYRGGAAAN